MCWVGRWVSRLLLLPHSKLDSKLHLMSHVSCSPIPCPKYSASSLMFISQVECGHPEVSSNSPVGLQQYWFISVFQFVWATFLNRERCREIEEIGIYLVSEKLLSYFVATEDTTGSAHDWVGLSEGNESCMTRSRHSISPSTEALAGHLIEWSLRSTGASAM